MGLQLDTVLESLHPPLVLQHLCWTLLHSLWLLLIIALIYALLQRALGSKTRSQYVVGLIILLITGLTLPATFLVVSRFDSPAGQPNPLQELTTPGAEDILPALPIAEGQLTVLTRLRDSLAPYATLLLVAWCAGVALIAQFYLVRWCRFRVLLPGMHAGAPRRILRIERQTPGAPRTTNVEVVESSLVEMPATIGLLNPTLLLPIGAMQQLSPEHAEAIAIHELIHARRRDLLLGSYQGLLELLLFYHPAVWWMSARIRTWREYESDQLALRETGSTRKYLMALAELESLGRPRSNRQFSQRRLSRKLERFLGDPTLQLFGRGRFAGAAAVLAFVLLVSFASSLFAYSRSISGLRSLSAQSRFPTIVQNIVGVPESEAILDVLATTVSELHKDPGGEPPSLPQLAKQLVQGVDAEALTNAILDHLSHSPTQAILFDSTWRYGSFKDQVQIVALLVERAERLDSTDSVQARESARAAALFAAQCDFAYGASLLNALVLDPNWKRVADPSMNQMWRLRQLCVDEEDIAAAFFRDFTLVLDRNQSTPSMVVRTATDKMTLLRQLTELAMHRPYLQWRLRTLLKMPNLAVNELETTQLHALAASEPVFAQMIDDAATHKGGRRIRAISPDALQKLRTVTRPSAVTQPVSEQRD